MRAQEFDYLRDILKDRSGLVLSSEKIYLVESRLMPVARHHGLATLDDLVRELRDKRDESLLVEVTEAMTTNESFFFRDISPFENFREAILPTLMESRRSDGKTKIRIWSAACSSGQEPYTLAMILQEEAGKFAGLEIEIVATDLSKDIIAKAESGRYTQFEVQRGLPVQLLVKYFDKQDDHWEIKSTIRDMVTFRPFNLLEDFASLGTFDVVFCRNVLIYFDQETKSDVLRRVSRLLPNDGVLYLGGAESVLGISKDFKPLPGLRGVYGLVESDFDAKTTPQKAAG